MCSDLRPVILDSLEPRQDSSESASSWSLSALDEAASRVRLSLDFGSTPRVVVRERSGSAGTRRVQMLTHESSVEQESQLSQDSSNGSISQTEELADEPSSLDTSLHFRTPLESPGTTSTPVEGGSPTAEATPTSSLATPTGGSGRGLGRSVIVGGRAEGGGGRTESRGAGTSTAGEEATEQALSQG